MSSSALRFEPHFEPRAVDVSLTDTELRVRLADGRELSVPLEWFPRLRDAAPESRRNWRLLGGGLEPLRDPGRVPRRQHAQQRVRHRHGRLPPATRLRRVHSQLPMRRSQERVEALLGRAAGAAGG